MQLHLEDKLLLTVSSRAGAEPSAVTQPPLCLKPFGTEPGLVIPPAHGDTPVPPLLRVLSQQPTHFSYVRLLNEISSPSKTAFTGAISLRQRQFFLYWQRCISTGPFYELMCYQAVSMQHQRLWELNDS